ncbi:hypothetical protein POSPLADRAFT_1135348 [Postia placenta MAD-698-R-SB12]|uniref:DUF6697 domain-containing protein n=1 Tax=Postia placenta MAD-698-R-SB12 TaxID=670580 RepID=A0A1X6N8C5_9APHY|nr:hypothetical protein POSPLADRAFT_1135348 [Postia placenta MAD-698-R-SB12]OSX64889.1 hypothetical protein POSPLADRAFT_1135348 [Postia placenta MAD-698-R-SB12]
MDPKSGSAASYLTCNIEYAEYWRNQYQEVVQQLDRLKVVDSKAYNSYQYGLGVQHSSVSEELRALMSFVREEAERRQAADVELHRLLTCKGDTIPGECYAQLEKDKNELQMRLKKSQDELTVLVAKMNTFAVQATVLAAEAHKWRRDKILELFKTDSFVANDFDSPLLISKNPRLIYDVLPDVSYWFYPPWTFAPDVAFELVVEGDPHEWKYLGTYVTAPLVGYEMKLSEWMILDDEVRRDTDYHRFEDTNPIQTKDQHCLRVKAQILEQAQLPTTCTGLDVRRHYDIGEWSVPCYSLCCMGFSMKLHDALQYASKAVHSTIPLTHTPTILASKPIANLSPRNLVFIPV